MVQLIHYFDIDFEKQNLTIQYWYEMSEITHIFFEQKLFETLDRYKFSLKWCYIFLHLAICNVFNLTYVISQEGLYLFKVYFNNV